jgi:predicted porin
MGAAFLMGTAAFFGMQGTKAFAADLGGDCCSDLEERVSELEATTARKGNRKMSVQLYGQVTTALMYWNNGGRSDMYQVDGSTESSRFGLLGEAKVRPGLTAGFNIEIATQTARADRVTVSDDDGGDPADGAVALRKAYWYLSDEKLGKVSVGRLSFATDGVTEIDLSGTNIVSKSAVYWGQRIAIHPVGGASTAGNDFRYYFGPSNGNYEFDRNNGIRYDTPTYAGFQASAAWGEDDRWDIALRYAGEMHGFKLAAGIAYADDHDNKPGTALGTGTALNTVGDELPAHTSARIVSGSASAMHVATGLFVTAAAGQRTFDGWSGNSGVAALDFHESFWLVRSGIAKNWFGIGNTAVYGSYAHFVNANDNHAPATVWGVGVVQNIDAAAMELFLAYENHSADDPATNTDDTNLVIGGARVKF